jgi:hypothetical protein
MFVYPQSFGLSRRNITLCGQACSMPRDTHRYCYTSNSARLTQGGSGEPLEPFF